MDTIANPRELNQAVTFLHENGELVDWRGGEGEGESCWGGSSSRKKKKIFWIEFNIYYETCSTFYVSSSVMKSLSSP